MSCRLHVLYFSSSMRAVRLVFAGRLVLQRCSIRRHQQPRQLLAFVKRFEVQHDGLGCTTACRVAALVPRTKADERQ